jgi:membrane protein
MKVLDKGVRPMRGHKRLYASSLAFKTLLALMPALAIVMAVLASDSTHQKRDQILDQIVDAIYPVTSQVDMDDPSEPKNLQQLNAAGKQQIRISVKKFASHARRVGMIGFIGFVIVVFLLMRDVENSFNFLWGVGSPRPLFLQMVRHTIFFIGLPTLAVAFVTLKGWVGAWDWLRPLLQTWLFTAILPFLLLWAACAWMYLWIPNAKVEARSAAITGLFVAFILSAARWGVGWYALKILGSSNVYGALWLIPVVLIWFYISWTVILFGAEVTFFVQKHRTVSV